MLGKKPLLKKEFLENDDIRVLINLIEKYNYTNNECN